MSPSLAKPLESKYVYAVDIKPRPLWLANWEKGGRLKLLWLVEMIAEFTGVFIYVYIGVAASLAWNIGSLGKVVGLGSLATVGIAYGTGVVLAMFICGPTSGAHFNPAVTLLHVVLKGMSPLKGARYIFAQIFGGYIACLAVYVQWYTLIEKTEQGLMAAHVYNLVNFTPQGVAGSFALYVAADASLLRVLMNEFICDFILGLGLWTCFDMTNPWLPPSMAPWFNGISYALIIWSFGPVGISANTARDLGGRLAALTIWGRQSWAGTYAVIAAVTNIPATFLAVLFYELFFVDSGRVVPSHHLEFMGWFQGHAEYYEQDHHSRASPVGKSSGFEATLPGEFDDDDNIEMKQRLLDSHHEV